MYVPIITLLYIIIPYLYEHIGLCNSLIYSYSTTINACKKKSNLLLIIECLHLDTYMYVCICSRMYIY